MKKILFLLLLIPFAVFPQGSKIKDLPTTTTGTINDFLLKDYYTGASGATQKITVGNFLSTYSLTTNGVSTVTVTPANGVSATTGGTAVNPVLAFTLGAITPSSVVTPTVTVVAGTFTTATTSTLTADYIGVGTSAPATKIQVVAGEILLDNNRSYNIKTSGGANKTILRVNSGDTTELHSARKGIQFKDNSNRTQMFLDSLGNLGIGTTAQSASTILDLTSTTKAFLPTRWSTTQMNAIASPVNGMFGYNNTTHSYYGYQGGAWASIGSNMATANLTAAASYTATFTGYDWTLKGGTFTRVGSGATSGTVNNSQVNSSGLVLSKMLDDGTLRIGDYLNGTGTARIFVQPYSDADGVDFITFLRNVATSTTQYVFKLRQDNGGYPVLRSNYAKLYLETDDGAGLQLVLNNTANRFDFSAGGNLFTSFDYNGDSYINNAQNFGLGTASPTAKIHVKGTGTGAGTTTALFENSAGTDILKILDDKSIIAYGSILKNQGADVASVAGAIALGSDGNTFEITGTNAITLISNLTWQNGAEVTLIFTSTATLTNGTATSGTDITLKLAGAANFVASADDSITLVLCEIGGVQAWREKCRSVN